VKKGGKKKVREEKERRGKRRGQREKEERVQEVRPGEVRATIPLTTLAASILLMLDDLDLAIPAVRDEDVFLTR